MAKAQPILKQVFMETVSFLKWARLPDEDVRSLAGGGYFDGITNVFISPDVHSLHIVWEEPGGVIAHEIADYPYDGEMTVTEFLADEIAADSWELIEDKDVYSVLSDFKDWTAENTPVITLARLQEAEKQAQAARSLFVWLGVSSDDDATATTTDAR